MILSPSVIQLANLSEEFSHAWPQVVNIPEGQKPLSRRLFSAWILRKKEWSKSVERTLRLPMFSFQQ
jgi:hypothetical protein